MLSQTFPHSLIVFPFIRPPPHTAPLRTSQDNEVGENNDYERCCQKSYEYDYYFDEHEENEDEVKGLSEKVERQSLGRWREARDE